LYGYKPRIKHERGLLFGMTYISATGVRANLSTSNPSRNAAFLSLFQPKPLLMGEQNQIKEGAQGRLATL
jgi:hypothetical protein